MRPINIGGGVICVSMLSAGLLLAHAYAATTPAAATTTTPSTACILASDAKLGWKLSTSRSSYAIRAAQKATNIIRPTLTSSAQSNFPTSAIISSGACTQSNSGTTNITITQQRLQSFSYRKTAYTTRPERTRCTHETCAQLLQTRYSETTKRSAPEKRKSTNEIDSAVFQFLSNIFLGNTEPTIEDTTRTQSVSNPTHIKFTDIPGISTACNKYAHHNESLIQRYVNSGTIDCTFDTLSSVAINIPSRPTSDGITHYAITYRYDRNQKTTFYVKPALRGDTHVIIDDLIPAKKLLYQFSIQPIGLYTYRTY